MKMTHGAERIDFAPGVTFDADRHEYWYKGKKLSGVTGLIAKKLKIKMPEEFVAAHQEEGTHVHNAAQRWIETGDSGSVHPGVRWLTETFIRDAGAGPAGVWSEVLVSDLKQYASAVDIVVERKDGTLTIYDLKKGIFKRDYCTAQLSIYRYFIEQYCGRRVARCVIACVRDREYYPIFPLPFEKVEKLLYG
jgi:hypothetical protein